MTERETPESERPLLSRRDLLKAAPAAGLVAATAALIDWGASGSRTVSGECRICLGHCGLLATIRDDRVVRVEGDPASSTKGFICLHGLAIREIVHSRARIRRPLKRVGDSFEEISWERAIEEIASRLLAVKGEFGPQALAVYTGWPLVEHPIIGFLLRFCQAFGSPNFATVASLCESAGRMGQALTAGSKLRAHASRSRTAVVWGANPGTSFPVLARVLAAAGREDRNLIVIDPVTTELAAKATVHLKIRPGTDGALALGLMNVIVEENLYDGAYVEMHTVGFDRLLELLPRYDPARVADITSLRPDEIYRVARIIAREGPTSIRTGLGIEHHENGTQTIRAITILAALCGHIDVPGGDVLVTKASQRMDGRPLPSLYRMATPRPAPPPVGVRPIGYDEYPLFEVYNRQAQANLFAGAILEDDPYPLRALILMGSNPLLTSPDSARLRRAAEKLSLLVSIDPFLTPSGELAHYVLPAATFAEGRSEAGGALIAERHESWTDWKILTRLAAALGIGQYFPWPTLEEALTAPPEFYMRDPEHTLLADQRADDARPRFPSASGKIEIYSRTLERFGYNPLPEWKEPSERPGGYGSEFPLILVTGPRTRAYINSQFRQIQSVSSKMPRPLAEVHPDAARSAGIADGDPVAIVSPHGRIVLHAKVTTRVHPQCVIVPVGWSDANANLLTRDGARDPITGFPAFRSGVCRLEAQPRS